MLDLIGRIYNNLDFSSLALLVPLAVFLVHFVPWVLDSKGIRSYPGPFLAKFSDLWLHLASKAGHRSETVHQVHLQYGPIVRIAPNHISIADSDALNIIYGHGNGALKSDFYDAFVSIRRGLFNTRDRADHTRKRKFVSHIFSQKTVVEFEPHLQRYVGLLINQWDRLYDLACKGLSGNEGEGGWTGKNGRLWLDLLPWSNYLAFDIIGDLAFGAPFGMIEAGRDIALAPKDYKNHGAAINSKQLSDSEVIGVPAVKVINGRGDFSMSMGVLPPSWRPWVRHLPGYRQGSDSVKRLAGIAIMAVRKRLATPTDRVDLLSKLQNARDSDGKPMDPEELTAEALTFLIAGSDTTSNSTCAIIYHLAHNPHVQDKLQKVLDDCLGSDDEAVPNMEQVKSIDYLDACINEALRIHSTSALGLPRLVPKGGMVVLGQFFPEGTVLSVPSYTIHRDPNIWGEDVEAFRPERWFERDQEAIQKTFNPFSIGPRACIGRNLAFMELQIIIAALVRRYHFVLEDINQPFDTREGFLRKPVSCKVGIKRRDVL